MTRVERLARHGPPALVLALGIAGTLAPEPWSLRAAMAQFIVLSVFVAPLASKAMVEFVMGPIDVRELRDAAARALAVEREFNEALAGYLGWRVRILGVLRGYRTECVQNGAHRLVDQVDPMIRDLAAEVGPLPERTDAN